MDIHYMLYYYVPKINKDVVESTNKIDEFVMMLVDGKIDFITDKQRAELKLDTDYLIDIKKKISQYNERVPLYDIRTNNIYMIYKNNVFTRIFRNDYRFVTQDFYDDLQGLAQLSENDKNNLRILKFYDMDMLYQTYLKIFYESFVMDSYITQCKRPSFSSKMDHIRPYYSSPEIYYLAYDWNLTDKATLQPSEIRELCPKIAAHDIPGEILLKHQIHIFDRRAIGLVKHYSLFGSYFINSYLRTYRCCMMEDDYDESKIAIKNPILENQIKLMIKLIQTAPAFDQSYTLYRFIDDDSYLKHLNVNDIYTDPSFLSTTRDPVHYQENYSFGYILIKIKVPGTVRGIGLCVEAYSNFPEEQEIILPPTSRYRLDAVIENTAEYHDVIKLNKRVQKKYEFTLLDNKYLDDAPITLDIANAIIPTKTTVDFKQLIVKRDVEYISIANRLDNFTKNYLNENYQFSSMIGNNEFTFVIESYNSTSVYKDFFYYQTATGLVCYSSNPTYGNINIMMEIGVDIHVNYYFKYSVTDSSQQLDLSNKEWIEWLSTFAYYIGSESVIIHSNYTLFPNKKTDTIEIKQNKTRYTFSDNIYQYLKHGKKFFDDNINIRPNFDYGRLDVLAGSDINDIISQQDRDEIYQIAMTSNISSVKNLYIHIIEHFPQFIVIMETKMETIYPSIELNPFYNISYTLDVNSYLYEMDLIKHVPSKSEYQSKKGSFKHLVGKNKIKQFKNRLRSYLLKKN